MFGYDILAAPAPLAGLFDAVWDVDMPDGARTRRRETGAGVGRCGRLRGLLST